MTMIADSSQTFSKSRIVLFVTLVHGFQPWGLMSGKLPSWMLWGSWISLCIQFKNFSIL